MDVPILVNHKILGGWKYVTQSTGIFFDTDDDVAQAAAQCLSSSTDPRAWFHSNYGPVRSSERLSSFLHSLDGDFDPLRPCGSLTKLFCRPEQTPDFG